MTSGKIARSAALAAGLLFTAVPASAQMRLEVVPGEMPNWVRDQIGRDLRDMRDSNGNWRQDRWRRRAANDDEDDAVKICSALVPGAWRDTIQVPQSWSPANCDDFARALGATQTQIGCIFASGRSAFVLVGVGQTPHPDCGWTPSREDDDNAVHRRPRPPGG